MRKNKDFNGAPWGGLGDYTRGAMVPGKKNINIAGKAMRRMSGRRGA